VDLSTSGFDLHTAGIILMVGVARAGGLGAVVEQLLPPEPPQERGQSRQVIEERRIERELPRRRPRPAAGRAFAVYGALNLTAAAAVQEKETPW
jgi:hypothetical protein